MTKKKEQKKFESRKWDLEIKSIDKLEREKKDVDVILYKLVAKEKDGVNSIVITSESPFKGLSAKDGVIQVELRQSQKSIEDFTEKEEEEET